MIGLSSGFIGPPAVVEVDIVVRSMGPISEVDMVIIMGAGLIS